MGDVVSSEVTVQVPTLCLLYELSYVFLTEDCEYVSYHVYFYQECECEGYVC